jgi:protein-tyrosine phosphatase
MAAAILRRRLADRGVEARVRSAGTRAWDVGATAGAVEVMREHGIDLSAHRGCQLTAELVAEAELVLGMTRDHVAIAAARCPQAAAHAFLVGELVRLGREIGPRASSEPVSAWAARAAARRPPRRPVGRAVDEIADPVGLPIEAYRRTAARLDADLTSLAGLLAADGAG